MIIHEAFVAYMRASSTRESAYTRAFMVNKHISIMLEKYHLNTLDRPFDYVLISGFCVAMNDWDISDSIIAMNFRPDIFISDQSIKDESSMDEYGYTIMIDKNDIISQIVII